MAAGTNNSLGVGSLHRQPALFFLAKKNRGYTFMHPRAHQTLLLLLKEVDPSSLHKTIASNVRSTILLVNLSTRLAQSELAHS